MVKPKRINLYICGDAGPWDEFNPFSEEDIQLMAKKCNMFALELADRIMERSRSIEDAALKVSSSKQVDLRKILLMRNFDFRMIYVDVWHWIFGQSNRILADRGFIYDPPRRKGDEARYIAWVSEFSFPE
jgi:elongation factor P hydroxylase